MCGLLLERCPRSMKLNRPFEGARGRTSIRIRVELFVPRPALRQELALYLSNLLGKGGRSSQTETRHTQLSLGRHSKNTLRQLGYPRYIRDTRRDSTTSWIEDTKPVRSTFDRSGPWMQYDRHRA